MLLKGLGSIAILGLFLSAVSVAADTLISEVRVYQRCYTQLVRERLPLTDPVRAQVAAGTTTAVNACMNLLRSAQFDTTGKIANYSDPVASRISRRILETLSDFHRSWFGAKNMKLQLGSEFLIGVEMYDTGEMSYHLTRSLFQPGVEYQEIFTRPTSFHATRIHPVSQSISLPRPIMPSITIVYGSPSSNNRARWDAWLMPRGLLVGVENAKSLILPGTPGFGDYRLVPTDTNIHESLGGGILGSRAFLFLNLGLYNYLPDGGKKVARRWSVAVYKDLLCRDIPVIRSGDGLPFVQSTSTLPFRKSPVCMQCHASMDSMAYTARNARFVYSGWPAPPYPEANSWHVFKEAVTLPPETGVPDKDTLFRNRPPNGKFYFRTFNGELVNQTVNGLGDLGRVMTQHDDPYVCAAKRYYRFFTGIDVPIYDFNDPASPKPSADRLKHRNLVLDLGRQLHGDQNLMNMIRKILESENYKSLGYGAGP